MTRSSIKSSFGKRENLSFRFLTLPRLLKCTFSCKFYFFHEKSVFSSANTAHCWEGELALPAHWLLLNVLHSSTAHSKTFPGGFWLNSVVVLSSPAQSLVMSRAQGSWSWGSGLPCGPSQERWGAAAGACSQPLKLHGLRSQWAALLDRIPLPT